MYGIFDTINNLKRLTAGDPQVLYDSMMKNNPQFAEFVKANEGKTPEEIAQSYGIDLGVLRQLMR